MGNFNRNRGGFGGGRREGGFNRGGRGGFNRGGRGSFGGDRPDMHKAICAECGDECQVPFRPTGDRPVLCSRCFKGPGHNGPRREERRDFDRPRFKEKQMFSATCASCGASCQVPFRPRPGKEVFCDACFGKDAKPKGGDLKVFDRQPSSASGNYDKQFEALNFKLNKIIELLDPSAKAEVKKAVKEIFEEKVVPAAKEVVVEEVVKEKKVAKKADKKGDKKEVKKETAKEKKPVAKKAAKKK